jgi:hypothetical protein
MAIARMLLRGGLLTLALTLSAGNRKRQRRSGRRPKDWRPSLAPKRARSCRMSCASKVVVKCETGSYPIFMPMRFGKSNSATALRGRVHL